jgi:hypothetical protein
MAIKLHRCRNQWVKLPGHPCWRVEKALMEMGVDYERVPGGWPKRPKTVQEHTGVDKYPAIESEDGSWYRDQSTKMAETIRAGRLNEVHGKTPRGQAAA